MITTYAMSEDIKILAADAAAAVARHHNLLGQIEATERIREYLPPPQALPYLNTWVRQRVESMNPTEREEIFKVFEMDPASETATDDLMRALLGKDIPAPSQPQDEPLKAPVVHDHP